MGRPALRKCPDCGAVLGHGHSSTCKYEHEQGLELVSLALLSIARDRNATDRINNDVLATLDAITEALTGREDGDGDRICDEIVDILRNGPAKAKREE